jgi:hypothetical protein
MYNIRIPHHHQDGRVWVIVNSIFLLIFETMDDSSSQTDLATAEMRV